MTKKLVLGTAQFFTKYGVENKKVSNKRVVRNILKYAYKNKFRYLDTAIGYKNCDKNLGIIGVNKWNIITKINFPNSADKKNIIKKILTSKKKLKIKQFYGILVHNPFAVSKKIFLINYKNLLKLKKMGIVKKIGISIYGAENLNFFISKVRPDIVQTSLNIFDQRILNFLKKSKTKKIEFFARSIFLQGLLIQKKIPKKFEKFKTYLKKIKNNYKKNNMTALEFSINFIKTQKKIENFIFGVSSLSQLKEIIKVFKSKRILKINFEKISSNKINLIDPRTW